MGCISRLFRYDDRFSDGIVRRARGPSIYKKAPAHSDRSSILVGLLLEKPRLARELFLSRAQFSLVVSYRQPESPQGLPSPSAHHPSELLNLMCHLDASLRGHCISRQPAILRSFWLSFAAPASSRARRAQPRASCRARCAEP